MAVYNAPFKPKTSWRRRFNTFQPSVCYGHEILPNRPKIICSKEQCIREIGWKLSISFQVPSNFREVPTRSLCCQLHLVGYFSIFCLRFVLLSFIVLCVCMCVCALLSTMCMYMVNQTTSRLSTSIYQVHVCEISCPVPRFYMQIGNILLSILS